jgi:chromate transporter
VPFPLIVIGAAMIGIVGRRGWPASFPPPATAEVLARGDYLIDRRIARGELNTTARSIGRSIVILAVCIALWFVPILAVVSLAGADSVLARLGLFFSQAAVVTFGGAYAVLAYIAQRAVEGFGWLTPGEMVDGLALAETTPGPLIMVVQYVAFLAAFRHPDGLSPYAAAVLGSLLTTWVTFVPCFLWVLVGAPYVEKLRSNRVLHAALSSVTAAIVGVVLNLSVWFTLHTVFRQLGNVAAGPAAFEVPVWSSLNPGALLIAIAALVAMLRFRIGLGWTLSGAAAIGVVWTLVFSAG